MHNREQHGGRIVPFETLDAVKDPFEASKRRKEFLSKGIEEEPACSSTMTASTAIQRSVIVQESINELTNQTGSDDADTRTAFVSVSDFSEFPRTEDNSSSSCYRTDEPDAWVDCAGLLERMLELVNNDGNLALNLVKEAAVPDIELFALHVVNLADTLLNQCNKLKKIATHCLCEIKENEG